jgi:glutamate/tyrosine decarboxylase-like PLP-dependent enzyme
MNNEFLQLIEDGFGLLLPKAERETLWHKIFADCEGSLVGMPDTPVYDVHAQSKIAASLATIDFAKIQQPVAVVQLVINALKKFQLNTSHPLYFGVFNPAPSTMGVFADAIAAFFNPQLASTASSKWCIKVEDLLLSFFGKKFGLNPSSIEGCFTSGATEANYTALLCALNYHLPQWHQTGLMALSKAPTVYVTRETHHSISRAVNVVGLGQQSLRIIQVNESLQCDETALIGQIKADIALGHQPLFLVATLGSTSAGVVDPLYTLASIAKNYGLWFHVDAAWGGALSLLPEFAELMQGVECADSIAFDPHKWLSLPMGCGMYLSRHRGHMRATFDVEESHYMPLDARCASTTEPYRQTLQWSRRFIGLKLFMTLLAHGESGYQHILRHQIRMGNLLRNKLLATRWVIKNQTPLPVVCFTDPDGLTPEDVRRDLVATKRAFLTTTQLTFRSEQVLRAGIASFLTQANHIDELVLLLNQTRDRLAKSQ